MQGRTIFVRKVLPLRLEGETLGGTKAQGVVPRDSRVRVLPYVSVSKKAVKGERMAFVLQWGTGGKWL